MELTHNNLLLHSFSDHAEFFKVTVSKWVRRCDQKPYEVIFDDWSLNQASLQCMCKREGALLTMDTVPTLAKMTSQRTCRRLVQKVQNCVATPVSNQHAEVFSIVVCYTRCLMGCTQIWLQLLSPISSLNSLKCTCTTFPDNDKHSKPNLLSHVLPANSLRVQSMC